MLDIVKRCMYQVDITHLTNKTCYNCKKKIMLDDSSRDNIYFYQIHGLGKRDQQYICHPCLLLKAHQSKS